MMNSFDFDTPTLGVETLYCAQVDFPVESIQAPTREYDPNWAYNHLSDEDKLRVDTAMNRLHEKMFHEVYGHPRLY